MKSFNRHTRWAFVVVAVYSLFQLPSLLAKEPTTRPNILFAFADDWGRHASIYPQIDGTGGINDLVQTPNFDKVARSGVLFRNAFVSIFFVF